MLTSWSAQKDLSIVGTTHDGKGIKVFENGNFVI